MGITQIQAFKCERCLHIWLPRDVATKLGRMDLVAPKVCPSCKSPYWNTPRKTVKKVELLAKG